MVVLHSNRLLFIGEHWAYSSDRKTISCDIQWQVISQTGWNEPKPMLVPPPPPIYHPSPSHHRYHITIFGDGVVGEIVLCPMSPSLKYLTRLKLMTPRRMSVHGTSAHADCLAHSLFLSFTRKTGHTILLLNNNNNVIKNTQNTI